MLELQEYVDTQVAQISPFKKISFELANRANLVEVTDDKSLKCAVDIRRDITKHAVAVKNARLSITRQFDEVKSQFIEAEKDVLEPAENAKTVVGNKIMDYEVEQERIRMIEERRIDEIISKFDTNVRQIRTLKAIDERGAELKAIFSTLPEVDQSNSFIKLAFTQAINSLLTRKDEIRTAEVNAIEQAKAELKRRDEVERAELEAEKTEKLAVSLQKKAPKTGIKMVTKFTITNPELVPREFCIPSDQLIREAVKNGVTNIAGILITQERSF